MRNTIVIMILSLAVYACKNDSVSLSPSSQLITANERNSALSAYVNSYHAGLRLLNVSTKNINSSGRALTWSYCFVDTSVGTHPTYYFHATLGDIGFDSTGQLVPGPSVITLRWCDSDSAVIVSEQSGGANYRNQNPNGTMTAYLGQIVNPNPVVTWRIIYQGGPIGLGLIIDASTGLCIGQSR